MAQYLGLKITSPEEGRMRLRRWVGQEAGNSTVMRFGLCDGQTDVHGHHSNIESQVRDLFCPGYNAQRGPQPTKEQVSCILARRVD